MVEILPRASLWVEMKLEREPHINMCTFFPLRSVLFYSPEHQAFLLQKLQVPFDL